MSPNTIPSQLLRTPSFPALFTVQFFGAFNDNLFKNALVVLITYRLMADSDAGLTITLAAGLFILPFFLFSPFAGALADRMNKVWLIQKIKLAEILIMLLASLSLISGDIGFMLACLFLLGAQSAFFGPIKYAILPEFLPSDQWMQGNAWFSGSTFVAILIGTVLGGLLILYEQGILWLSLVMLSLALLGYLAARTLPALPSIASKQQDTVWLSYRQLFFNFGDGRGYLVLAISCFWFIGASLLSQFPVWVKDFLYGNEQVAVLFLALFAVGFGLGSWGMTAAMKGRVVLSFQPALLVLMGLALADAIWASYGVKPTDTLLSPLEFLSSWPNSRVLFDLWLIAMLGGAYCVPLYTQLQRQVRDHQRARAFALNNVMNAFFMVISAILILLAYTLGLNWLEMAIWGIGLIVIMAIGFQLTYKNVDFL